ncbi:MAG: hypothetical protein EOO22_10160, partial [Comamonadaceae bacterium]
GKTSDYGNVVGTGVLAQNHQHIFAFRIDPAIDGHSNTVIQEESHPVPLNAVTNPRGNYYEVRKTPIKRSGWADAAPQYNRVFKMVNTSRKNRISGNPVGYKLTPPATHPAIGDAELVTNHLEGGGAGRATRDKTHVSPIVEFVSLRAGAAPAGNTLNGARS